MTWEGCKLRLRALFAPRRAEADLDEELQFHIAMQTRKHRTRGLDEAGAQTRAALEFGGVTQVREACRDQRGVNLVESIAQDVRYAIRGFARTPGFAVTVVATIALGLGLNTAVFTLFNAYVLRPLAVRDPYSLYEVVWTQTDGQNRRMSLQELEDCRKSVPAFSESYGYDVLANRVNGRTLIGQFAGGNYFTMLGGTAALGRTLLPDDEVMARPVAVLSFRAWKNKFGADPDIVDKKLMVRGYPLQIVGVARAGFIGVGQLPWDFWMPLSMSAPMLGAGHGAYSLVGRLRPGWSPRRVQPLLLAWARRNSAGLPAGEKVVRAELISRASTISVNDEVVAGMTPIFAAFALVLAVACANIANLMLARGMSRQREIGVRLAIGAARPRLIRQLLTESILLALPAAIVGLVVSEATLEGCVRLLYATLPRAVAEVITIIPLHPDWRVFGFMVAVSIVAALLFGLIPALQATRPDIMRAARGEFTADHRPARLRHALVVAQVTVSALILICSLILLRVNLRVSAVDPGLQVRSVVQMPVADRLREKLAKQLLLDPVVESVAATSKVPFGAGLPYLDVAPAGAKQRTWAGYMLVSADYFSIFELPILRGRVFTEEEARANRPVAVISESTARRLFRGDPLAQRFSIHSNAEQRARTDFPPYSEARVIGVARDAVNGRIADGIDPTCIYFPATLHTPGRTLLARVRGGARAALPRLDAAMDRSFPGAVNGIIPMEDILNATRYPYRVAYWVSAALGSLALALTLAGIYGVLSYLVAQRRKEIGIRVALGARYGDVVGLVIRQSMRFAAIGTGIGALGAWGVSRFLASQISAVQSFDIRAFAIGVSVIFTASAFAAWAPSIRAARIEPVTTLRCD